MRQRRRTPTSSDGTESDNRHSNMSELSVGLNANRHEAGGNYRTSQVDDKEEGDGSNVRWTGTITTTNGAMQELPI